VTDSQAKSQPPVSARLDKSLWFRTTKDITQILFQIAVAAGVVLTT
jgi:hypothetical protein